MDHIPLDQMTATRSLDYALIALQLHDYGVGHHTPSDGENALFVAWVDDCCKLLYKTGGLDSFNAKFLAIREHVNVSHCVLSPKGRDDILQAVIEVIRPKIIQLIDVSFSSYRPVLPWLKKCLTIFGPHPKNGPRSELQLRISNDMINMLSDEMIIDHPYHVNAVKAAKPFTEVCVMIMFDGQRDVGPLTSAYLAYLENRMALSGEVRYRAVRVMSCLPKEDVVTEWCRERKIHIGHEF